MNRQIRTTLPASIHAALLHLRIETGMTLGELLAEAALVLLHQAGRGAGLAAPTPIRTLEPNTRPSETGRVSFDDAEPCR